MKETILSRSMRRLFAGGAAVGLTILALPAHSQDDQSQPMQRVEVTGSSIRRLASETSLPITTLRASDFAKQGLTTAQDVLNTIPMNQSSQGSSQSVGAGTGGRAVADLRGLGGDKTLVLLNGRRLANHPFFADTVDLNIIPVAALERVEVLRDGASAIYGTDAIGGVINFITKKSVKGAAVTFEAYEPLRTGGGAEQRLNISGGWGDLNTDGYSMFGVVDWHQQTALTALDRVYSRTGIRPEFGVDQTSGTPFPANFFAPNPIDPNSAGITGNPYFASGCRPPLSVPSASSPTCRYDFSRDVDLLPKTNQLSVLARFNRKFNADHTGAIEYMHSRSTNVSRVAPPPMANIGITMFSTSPFYPGGPAGVPAFPGLTGEPLSISWRPQETGRREQFDASMSDRLLASLEGNLNGWDYSGGISHSVGRANSAFTGGYVIDQRIIDGVGNGILNPFGPQTPAGLAYLNNSLLIGRFLNARINSSAIDFHASRELMTLPAGPLSFALGAEWRHDKATYTVNRDLAGQASSSGYAGALDQSGSRNIAAVFTEVNVPIIKDLELNAAGRYDRYSDVGGRFNPKVSLRYQPTRQLLLRSSYNRGFRAPTLFDLYGPQTVTFSSDQYDDPRLCPGGVPAPGADPSISCGQQQFIQQGGNPNLTPEKSRTYSIGAVFEPIPSFTASVDYWDIKLKDQINALPEQTIFGNIPKYQNLFNYNAAGTRLNFVTDVTSNLGEVKTRGLDLSFLWRLPKNPWGNFTVNIDGTYVNRYDYQNERGGPFIQNAGRYADATPVFRWRHNLLLSWAQGDWTVNLANRYNSHYIDQNAVDPEFARSVKHWSMWTLSGTYTGNRNVDFTAGVKNLFDQDPPYSNQITNFQQGYDPRYTDPLGATVFMRVTYKF
ncbi:MAG: TonB-dependent receptor [Massilia sp.]|nr:TonB-dependent receptor [Massilia sp.]